MADDIQIKAAQPQNAQPATTGAANSNATSASSKPSIIDLRNMDQKAAPAPGAVATNSTIVSGNGAAAGTAASGSTDAEFIAPSGQKYTVPPMVTEKFPDLVQLIKQTESMNDEEREYWFQILPIMTEDQIKKFRDILVNEKEQLTRLDKEYEEELNKLNEKHMIEWKDFEMKEKRKALAQAEQQTQQQEQSEEEELLKRLSQV